MIFSEYMQRNYQNKFYSKAQNLVQHLTMEYNKILKEYDVIVMPTLPGKAFSLPTKDHSIKGDKYFHNTKKKIQIDKKIKLYFFSNFIIIAH